MQEEKKSSSLLQSFGLKMAIIIVMSSIIGSGVFKKVAPMAELLHTPWLIILAWLLAGIVILFGVLSIAELAVLYPQSGGPFHWLEKIYGKTISFLYGWSCFTVIQTAAISSIAFVFAGALNTFVTLPQLPLDWQSISFLGLHPFSNFGAKIVACLLIIFLTQVNIKGAKKGGNLSLVFTFLIIGSILIISIAAFSGNQGSIATFQTPSSNYPVAGFGALGLFSAMVLAMRNAFWGYEGWIALGFIGEEIKNPTKNLPKALTIGIALIILLYLIINTAYLYIMPIDEMLAALRLNENNIAAVVVTDKILGTGGAYIISGMILISTLGCTNATILVSSRIYYAMAKKGLFFEKAAKIHPKNKTPHFSLNYQCFWACILIFSGSFDTLTDLLIITAFIFFGIIVFGVIYLRIKDKNAPRLYKTPGYPFVPLIFVIFCIILLVVSFIESPVKSIIGIGFIFSGLPFYYYWKKKLPHNNMDEE
ncbi:APC family permease [Flavobacterium sp. SM2513]|uniref:APC family permease n=1 Tax=Flavobacterium sp. SM2513 TaxID=3424766 RepID=UPI003D7F79DB